MSPISVGYSGQGHPFVSVTTASTSIGAYVCRYVQEVTGTERNIKRNVRDGIYNICYWKEQAKGLSAHLYCPGCLSLQREQAAAESLSAWVRPAGMKVMSHRRWQEWEDRVLLEHHDAESAAEALGRTVQSCSLRLWRFRTGRIPMPTDGR
ncbi:hypothetical protein P1S61_38895 [Streptomyces sp. ME08-AFT2]|uniref:hypothetical protein n=1 Tax=Streptomyces sp. ME08-AFT2 TaxID=3028683 RepID=UPI0029BF63D3|nr:hypothetical protein [Streptomyces sp. ME08-AFT2]MDX3314921.1 hypothetical protein [Streptomyces sp. ME08-AFT2]